MPGGATRGRRNTSSRPIRRTTWQKPIGSSASRCGIRSAIRIISRRRGRRSRSSGPDSSCGAAGGASETVEGGARDRNVVVEFADRATAAACYQSPEYQAAKAIRQKYADADFIIIDGTA